MGMFRGPRVNSMNLGSPWRETSKNWQKVMRLPDFGYSDVTRSKVRALLRAESWYRTTNVRNGNITRTWGRTYGPLKMNCALYFRATRLSPKLAS